MGRQTGIIDLLGTVGNITFVKGAKGIEARKKNVMSGSIAGKRSAENMAEFTRAGMASRYLGRTVKSLVTFKERYLHSRIMAVMMKVVKSDLTSLRGDRNVQSGNVELFKGFEFNSKARLETVFSPLFAKEIDRAAGTASVVVTPFLTEKAVYQPAGATHFRLIAAVIEIDFETGERKVSAKTAPEMVYSLNQIPETTLDIAFEPNSTLPIFLLFGIEFLQQVNGKMYPFDLGTDNGFAIVEVEGIV